MNGGLLADGDTELMLGYVVVMRLRLLNRILGSVCNANMFCSQ